MTKKKTTPVPTDGNADEPTWETLREEFIQDEKKHHAPTSISFYTTERWKGVKDVFKCARCGTFRDTRDAMIEHILLHYPANEQETIFNQLVKEQ